jgi:hypothetical protein
MSSERLSAMAAIILRPHDRAERLAPAAAPTGRGG